MRNNDSEEIILNLEESSGNSLLSKHLGGTKRGNAATTLEPIMEETQLMAYNNTTT